MSSTSSTGMSTTTATAGALVATAGVLMLLRTLKRRSSPEIRSKLSCRCGKVQGEICAKQEDSVRLHCYCSDCRDYAHFIARLDGNGDEKSPMINSCGETHLVQVCKSAVAIDQGAENLKLARKNSMGMFRYYASCCNTPIANTVDFLGYVGVFEDNMDAQREKFAGPWCFCTKEATKTPLENVVPDVPISRFLWNLLRYQPWSKAGPFDYSLNPTWWGETKKQE